MMGFFYGLRKRQALRAAVNDSAFKEDEHPMDKDGKFNKATKGKIRIATDDPFMLILLLFRGEPSLPISNLCIFEL